MQNRTAFAFLAGFASCCGALYGAGDHTAPVFFVLGAGAGCAAFMAFQMAFWRRELKSTRVHRRRKVSPRRPATVNPAPEVSERRKCEPGTFKKPTAVPASPVEADVISALKNFGASKTEARKLAGQAIAAAGAAATFEQIMRLALQRRRA